MLETDTKKIKIPKKISIFFGVLAVIAAVVFGFSYIANMKLDASEATTENVAGGATRVKNTGFDGNDTNDADPDAIQAYCDDIVANAKKEEGASKIRDMCVLNSITKEYLPLLTNEQIVKMANEQPSCLETGYDDEGFNCFTGYDRTGCSREGLDEEGNECRQSGVAKVPSIDSLIGQDPAKICSIVEGCKSESEFGPDGYNEYGCGRDGRRADGTLCPYDLITKIYGDDGRDQLGFNPAGFNENNCDVRGRRADGSACPIDQVTLTYDRNNKDIWGFSPDGYNSLGCDIRGLNREGEPCSLDDITHVFDPETGLDQFGLDKDGYNSKSCNLEGFNRSGERCDIENTPRIFGKSGVDQFSLLKNGRNKFNCDLTGRKPNGDLCPTEQFPRIYDPITGKDQFSFYKNGRNDYDCDVFGKKPNGDICNASEITRIVNPETGLDIYNLDKDGFSPDGCSLEGKRKDGTLCDVEDIPRVFGKNGLDQFSLNEKGKNQFDCGLDGLNSQGEICDFNEIPKVWGDDGFNQLGFDKENFNENGCSIDGLNRQGELCDLSDITRVFNKSGVDQFGLDEDGYSVETGCSLSGYRKDGSRCAYEDIPKIFDAKGINQLGLNKQNRNSNQCDMNGIKSDGSRCTREEKSSWFDDQDYSVYHQDNDGYSRLKLNELGYNKYNCDINGKKPDGSLCEESEITRIYDPVTMRDQFGLDKDGFNEFNCNLSGKDRNGLPCADEDIPRIFDKDMKDQFGVSINELPESVWQAQAEKNQLEALLDSNGKPLFHNGRRIFSDANGTLRYSDGSLVTTDDGEPLVISKDGSIRTRSGKKVSSGIFTDESGNAASGKIAKASDLFSSLTDSSGEIMMIDGKEVFVDKDGFLRDVNGNFITDENGEKLSLSDNGEIVNESGQVASGIELKRKDGLKQKGKLHTSPLSSKNALLNSKGQSVTYKDAPVYMDKEGFLVDENGDYILDDSGKRLTLSADGNIINEDGETIKTDLFSNATGKLSALENAIVNADGELITFDGKPVYIDDNGFMRDSNGQLILDESGNRLMLSPSGQIVNENGETVDTRRFDNLEDSVSQIQNALINADGELLTHNGKSVYLDDDGFMRDSDGNLVLDESGKRITLNADGDLVNEDGDLVSSDIIENLRDKLSSVDGALINEDGEPLTYNGKAVYLDANGFMRDSDGNLVLDDSGRRITLNSDGELVNEYGELVDPELLDNVKGAISTLDNALVDSSGELIKYNGKAVYLDDDGFMRDADGNLVLDETGKRITLNADGELVNEDGGLVSSNLLDNTKGKISLVDKALVNSNGELVTFDGKPVYIDDNGFMRDSNGQLILDDSGQRLRLNADGKVVNESGALVGSELLENIDSDLLYSEGALINSSGEFVSYNGKPVFMDEDGYLRDSNGELILGDNGERLRLSSDGRIVDESGKEVVLEGFKNADGSIRVSDNQKSGMRALLNDKGESVIFDGKAVMVGKDGLLRDINGDLILDEGGEPLTLNDRGQIVTKDGKVIPSNQFTNAKGESLSGAFSPSTTMLTESEIEAKIAAERLSPSQRMDLALDADGFNSAGCSLLGTDRSGKVCDIDDIPRVFDKETGLDQFGFGRDNFNAFGCDFSGFDRSGKKCEDKFITRIVGQDGFDQFQIDEDGFTLSGFNKESENRLGCTADGENCDIDESPKLRDSKGADQFNKLVNGSDRLGLRNDFNDKGCSLSGLNRSGEICAIEDIPRFINENGEDQFGILSNGKNRFGCGLDGKRADGSVCPINEMPRIFGSDDLDQFSLSAEGFNEFNCSLSGFDVNNERCEYDRIPFIYDDSGVNQLGFFADGYNANDCDINGVSRNGELCELNDITRVFDPNTGLDQFNLSRDGFNDKGCSLSGLNRQGELCAYDDIPKIHDPVTGLNQFGIAKDGFTPDGCSFRGYNREGEVCDVDKLPRVFDANNKDQFGADKETGLNANGCQLNGLMPNGKRCKPSLSVKFIKKTGEDQFGFIGERNINGCDINGLDENGERCNFDDVTRVIDPKTGRDQFGLDGDKRNINGCDVNGLDENGEACSPNKLFNWFDKSGKSQFGLSKGGYNEMDCNLAGFTSTGQRCKYEDVTRIVGINGLDQNNRDAFGFDVERKDVDGFYDDGCNDQNKNREGEYCDKYSDFPLDNNDVEYLTKRRELATAWLSSVTVEAKPIGEGTYKPEDNQASNIGTQTATPLSNVALSNGGQPVLLNNDTDVAINNTVIEIPAGYMTQIYVKTSINSDYTQDVYATIVLGELDEAMLIGKVVVPYIDDPVMPRDKFYYEFTKMIYNREEIPIDAVSISVSNDSGMVTADDVDYHRFQRYGGLLIASAVQALDASFLDSQAEQDLAAQSELTAAALQAQSVLYGENTRELTKQNLKVATGYVSDLAKQQFNRRPTITEGPGLHLIVFRSQVDDPRLPVVMTGIE